MPDVLDETGTIAKAGESAREPASHLTPIDFKAIDYVPGQKAPWRCSPHPCYGPDELGELRGSVDELVDGCRRADEAARLWEVLQAWEQRLFRRNYHFLNAGWKGWGMFGGSSGTTGASILQTQNAMKLFSANVYGARHKKIVALLSREVPPVEVVAEDDSNPIDQEAAQEAVPYLKAFRQLCELRRRFADAANYLYTDGRAAFVTYTVADSRFGTETDEDGHPVPARREIVRAYGKLETKVPLMADNQYEMGWARIELEVNRNDLRARYPWVRDRIANGGNKDDLGQLARMARANVRLAVQASSTSGEAWQQDTTESVTFFRPAQFEMVSDPNYRKMLYDNFPTGMEVWIAGGTLAMVRECSMDDHLAICHATPGDGQNRESIGTNYLPIQKVLNATISLLDRYFRGAVPRRFGMEPYLDCEATNQQTNDPAKITPVDGKMLVSDGLTIDAITGIEKVPEPNPTLLQYIQYLIQGMPEAMDGGTPAVFGLESEAAGRGTFGEARLNRDQALQVFSLPWGELCAASAAIQKQAIDSAALNRTADFTLGLPNERVRVSPRKLRGSVLVWPTSTEIPPTLAEQQAEIGNMLEQMGNVPIYASILSDPRNLEIVKRFPALSGLRIPGVDQVEQQMEENQQLLDSAPVPNPALMPLQEQMLAMIEQMQANPMLAQDPQMQQQMQQLQQQMQAIPPMISSVPVPSDASQDHQIHAVIALAELNSPRGRAATDEGKQNLHLHWSQHVAMQKQLTPPPPIPVHGSIALDIDKLPPAATSAVMERLSVGVPAPALVAPEQEHEITEETEGLDPQTGVPTKRKVSLTGKPL